MNFDAKVWRRFSLVAATSALLCAGGLASAPEARAQEATKSLLGFFGLQSTKDDESIDYRTRAPIVVPPRLDLPKPKEATRDPSWPKDPDIAAQRRAALDSHTPAAQVTPNARAEGDSLPAEGPPDECQASGTALCLSTPWKVLKSVTNGFTSSDSVQPGPEPVRKYLTEPPPGYRQPAAVTKAATEAPKDKPEPSNPAAPIRPQRPKTSIEN
jgi:hypothetical protein